MTAGLDVLVVGGGPVGIHLAALLAQAGVTVRVWESRAEPTLLSRAIGVHAPALDAFARVGVADEVVAEAVLVRAGVAVSGGRTLGRVSFAGVSPRHPYVAALPQWRTERILHARLEALAPGAIQRGVTLTAVDADPLGAPRGSVRLAGTRADSTRVEETAAFVVGADGPRSAVRALLGIGVDERPLNDRFLMGDAPDTTDGGDDAVITLHPNGVVESFPLPGGMRRWVVRLRDGDPPADGDAARVLASLVGARTGHVVAAEALTPVSGFGARRRLAERMVVGRVLIVGDAAHEISPIGGQGMNLGWLDADALAPLLVAAVRTRDGAADAAALAAWEVTRRRSARRAAFQSEINTALGRPIRGLTRRTRDAGLRAVLASPAGARLAAAYAMSWDGGAPTR